MGDEVGDRLLVAVGRRLREHLAPVAAVARVGADLFAVAVPIEAPRDAERVAMAIDRCLAEPFAVHGAGHPIHITACIGVAVERLTHPDHAGDLLHAATEALRWAKHVGPATTTWYDEAVHGEATRQLRLLGDLHRALDDDQLVLAYQPIVDIATGRPAAVEALVWWAHPVHGLLQPGQFLPAAEAAGLMAPIGHWVLRAACVQLAAWAQAVGWLDLPSLCVNVTADHFEHPGFVDEVAGVVEDTGIDPGHLVVELTEDALLQDRPAACANARALAALGVRVAIDDFGTGQSSLSYLRDLPVQVLKVDGSFVAEVDRSGPQRAIVAAILAVARSLHLTTIVEGVERPSQLAVLRELGCHYAQGFLWSRPVPADELERQLTADAPGPTAPWTPSATPRPVTAVPTGERLRNVEPWGGPLATSSTN